MGQETCQKLFGYKLSVNVDKKHKMIRKIVTDTASTGDSWHFENAFDPANTSRDVYADRGYPSMAHEAWSKRGGYRSQIQPFTPQRPIRRALEQSPELINTWLKETYPAIEAKAKAEGAVIFTWW